MVTASNGRDGINFFFVVLFYVTDSSLNLLHELCLLLLFESEVLFCCPVLL